MSSYNIVLNSINEIKTAAKENPRELFARLVQERLQLALKSYYADLTSKSDTLENRAESNTLDIMKKLVK